jgi:hypothetical protein
MIKETILVPKTSASFQILAAEAHLTEGQLFLIGILGGGV